MSVFEVDRREATRLPGPTRTRVFDREQILDAIRRWNALYGQPPLWIDWEPSRARAKGQDWRADRFEAGAWPTVRMVRRQFSTLGDAIAAAGLTAPKTRGRKANLSSSNEVLRAIREWTRRFGEPPTQTDLDPYRAQRTGQSWRIERYQEGDWPSLPTVRRHFGTLTAAVRAAGIEPPPPGESRTDRLARRRRNRLAMIDQIASSGSDHGPDGVTRAVHAVVSARNTRDAAALELALITLAGRALGWSDRLGRPASGGASSGSPRSDEISAEGVRCPAVDSTT